MEIRERIRAAIYQQGTTQAAIARALDEPEYWVSDRLTGRVKLLADELPRFAQALGCSPCDFFPPTESLLIASEDETLERLEGSLAAIRHDERRRIIRLIEQMDGLDDSA
jgi:transcriptional regulator with XRE-family HTH domain